MDKHAVVPIVDVVAVFEVFRDMLEVLVPAVGGVVIILGLEDAVLALREAAREDDLRAKLGPGSAIGKSLHAMRLFGVRAVRALGSVGEAATFGAAYPNDIGAVEVVQMLLEIALATETDRILVEEAHGALVLLIHRHDGPRRRVRGHIDVW